MSNNEFLSIRGIAERDWPVYDRYAFGTRKVALETTLRDNKERQEAFSLSLSTSMEDEVSVKAIVKSSDEATSYLLSNSIIFEELLLNYRKIHDDEDVLSFVCQWGFLDDSDFEFSPGMHYKGCLVDEIKDSAAYIRWLVDLSDQINNMEVQKLDSYIKFGPRNGKEVKGKGCVGVYLRDENREVIYPFETKDSPFPILMRGEEELLLYPISNWEKLGKRKGIIVAQDYLRCALLRLLRGVQPILEWKKTLGGERVLDESILVQSPWQAICYAVLLNYTKRVNFVSCKSCTNRFRTTRKDNVFCSPACSKAHNRKNGQTVHSYTKRKKG